MGVAVLLMAIKNKEDTFCKQHLTVSTTLGSKAAPVL